MPSICESERRVKCVAIGSRTIRTMMVSATRTNTTTVTRRAHRGQARYAVFISPDSKHAPRHSDPCPTGAARDDYVADGGARMNVFEVMTRRVFSCRPGDTLATAAGIMWDHDVG